MTTLWIISLILLPAIIAYVRDASPAIPIVLIVFAFISMISVSSVIALFFYAAAWVSAFHVRPTVQSTAIRRP